jgi:hypothetical protein
MLVISPSWVWHFFSWRQHTVDEAGAVITWLKLYRLGGVARNAPVGMTGVVLPR